MLTNIKKKIKIARYVGVLNLVCKESRDPLQSSFVPVSLPWYKIFYKQHGKTTSKHKAVI